MPEVLFIDLQQLFFLRCLFLFELGINDIPVFPLLRFAAVQVPSCLCRLGLGGPGASFQLLSVGVDNPPPRVWCVDVPFVEVPSGGSLLLLRGEHFTLQVQLQALIPLQLPSVPRGPPGCRQGRSLLCVV